MYKAISFKRWLIDNYPDEEDNPDLNAFLQCDGEGMNQDQECPFCMGTGSERYSEYEELTAIEREKWNKWQVLELLGAKSNGKA